MEVTPHPAPALDPRQRRREVDGLRGVAILLVVFHHYVNAALKPAAGTFLDYVMLPCRLAWTGVDLFFVLSGYLVGGILIANRRSPAFFKTFYVRRACRILPLYLVVLIAFYFLNGPVWGIPRPPMYQYLTLTQNFWMAAAGSFGVMTLAVTWSLAIEEQFYLTVPFLIRNIEVPRLWLAIASCIVAAPLFRLLLLGTIENAYFASHVLLFTRMDTLMIGVLAAWLQQSTIVLSSRFLYLAWLILGVGMLFLSWKERSPNLLIRVFCYDVFALFYVVTLLIALRGGLRFLRLRALAYIGTISYCVYLLHQPVNRLMHGGLAPLRSVRSVAITGAAFLTVLGLAALSWKFFEAHFVKLGHRQEY